MDEQRRLYYLDKMGIQTWVPQTAKSENTQAESGKGLSTPQTEQASDLSGQTGKNIAASLDELREVVAACTLCGLHRTRTQTVFGAGHPDADWLVIGEAPGFDEDRKGEPFVGRAGQLLTKMLLAIGLAREEVFITNILKCRPPDNRDPQPQEIMHCRPYLRQQIELIQPKIILAMGRIAAQALLNTNTAIGRLRGIQHWYEDTRIPVVATYHPAYLLRSPQQKRKAWDDLKFAVKIRTSQG